MATTQALDDIKLGDVVSYQYPDSQHLWGLRVMTEPSEGESFKAHMTETGKDWMIGLHPSLIPNGYTLVKKISSEKMEDFFHAGIRSGKFIHLPSALIDTESPNDDFVYFFEDGDQPILIKSVNDSYEISTMHEEFESLEETACFYMRKSRTEPYLMQIQYQISICCRKGDSCETSTFRSGWGYYMSRWVLTDSIEHALTYAESLEYATRKKSFDDFGDTNERIS